MIVMFWARITVLLFGEGVALSPLSHLLGWAQTRKLISAICIHDLILSRDRDCRWWVGNVQLVNQELSPQAHLDNPPMQNLCSCSSCIVASDFSYEYFKTHTLAFLIQPYRTKQDRLQQLFILISQTACLVMTCSSWPDCTRQLSGGGYSRSCDWLATITQGLTADNAYQSKNWVITCVKSCLQSSETETGLFRDGDLVKEIHSDWASQILCGDGRPIDIMFCRNQTKLRLTRKFIHFQRLWSSQGDHLTPYHLSKAFLFSMLSLAREPHIFHFHEWLKPLWSW